MKGNKHTCADLPIHTCTYTQFYINPYIYKHPAHWLWTGWTLQREAQNGAFIKTRPAVATSFFLLQLMLFLEWTTFPGAALYQWGWKDNSTTTGLGFLKTIAFKLWLTSLSVLSLVFSVVPVKRREAKGNRREITESRKRGEEDWGRKCEPRGVLIYQGNVFWFIFPNLQVVERIMELLRIKSLWDTVHGQGTCARGWDKECILIS